MHIFKQLELLKKDQDLIFTVSFTFARYMILVRDTIKQI